MATSANTNVSKVQAPSKVSRKATPPKPIERKPIPLFGTKPQPEPMRDGKKEKATSEGKELDFFKALKVEPIDLVDKVMDNGEFKVRLKRKHGEHPGDKKILDAILG